MSCPALRLARAGAGSLGANPVIKLSDKHPSRRAPLALVCLGSASRTGARREGRALRLLIVEDTDDVAGAVAGGLGQAGFACDIARDLAEARHLLDIQRYDAVVLDIDLPDGDGRSLLHRLRRRDDPVPVLMLTAEFAVSARIGALNDGADDYLVKPFDLGELEARLRVIIRRGAGRAEGALRVGDLVLDPAARSVHVADRPVRVTQRELALLNLLMRHPGRIIGKDILLEGLFSFEQSDVGINAVELYVARLRRKLAGSSAVIETHRGLGYRLVATDG